MILIYDPGSDSRIRRGMLIDLDYAFDLEMAIAELKGPRGHRTVS